MARKFKIKFTCKEPVVDGAAYNYNPLKASYLYLFYKKSGKFYRIWNNKKPAQPLAPDNNGFVTFDYDFLEEKTYYCYFAGKELTKNEINRIMQIALNYNEAFYRLYVTAKHRSRPAQIPYSFFNWVSALQKLEQNESYTQTLVKLADLIENNNNQFSDQATASWLVNNSLVTLDHDVLLDLKQLILSFSFSITYNELGVFPELNKISQTTFEQKTQENQSDFIQHAPVENLWLQNKRNQLGPGELLPHFYAFLLQQELADAPKPDSSLSSLLESLLYRTDRDSRAFTKIKTAYRIIEQSGMDSYEYLFSDNVCNAYHLGYFTNPDNPVRGRIAAIINGAATDYLSSQLDVLVFGMALHRSDFNEEQLHLSNCFNIDFTNFNALARTNFRNMLAQLALLSRLHLGNGETRSDLWHNAVGTVINIQNDESPYRHYQIDKFDQIIYIRRNEKEGKVIQYVFFYQDNVHNIKIEKKIKAETTDFVWPSGSVCLRFGVFIDGTENDLEGGNYEANHKFDAMTNVGKLFHAYKSDGINDIQAKVNRGENLFYGKSYQKGVGCGIESLTGSPFGIHGEKRIQESLEALARSINRLKTETGKYPMDISLDVFGFSRGAALARHFVNVISQKAYRIEGAPNDFIYDTIRCRYLGVFDTVGSFYKPGDNDDGNYIFHIDNGKTDNAFHLTADEEYRENFDLQSMKEDTSIKLQTPLIEKDCPGSHSDIGGGYKEGPEAGAQTNFLARVYLNEMYAHAKEKSVPFLSLQEMLQSNNADTKKIAEEQWMIDAALQSVLNRLHDYYSRFQNLKEENRQRRKISAFINYISYLKERRDEAFRQSNTYTGPAIFPPAEYGDLIRLLSKANKKLDSWSTNQINRFNITAAELEDFLSIYQTLDDGYIHTSHSTKTGMAPNMNKTTCELYRDTFFNSDKRKAANKNRDDDIPVFIVEPAP